MCLRKVGFPVKFIAQLHKQLLSHTEGTKKKLGIALRTGAE